MGKERKNSCGKLDLGVTSNFDAKWVLRFKKVLSGRDQKKQVEAIGWQSDMNLFEEHLLLTF